jgi:Domain of unknown function (DUF4249)
MPINSSISTFIILMSLFFGFNSCTKTKTFEVDNDNKLVVNSIIAPELVVRVAISETKPPQGSVDFVPLSDVHITLQGDNQSWVLDSFVPPGILKDIGFYTSKVNINIQTNQAYKLSIETANYPVIAVETAIPTLPTISNPVLSNLNLTALPIMSISPGYILGADLSFLIEDKIEKNDYYFLKVTYFSDYILGKTYPINLIDTSTTKSLGFSINNINDVTSSYLLGLGNVFSDTGFNGQNKEISVRLQSKLDLNNAIPDVVTLEVWSLNEDYYQYITSYNKQLSLNTDPFAEPLNIYSNISGGLGIFGGYSVAKIILPLQ